VVAAVLILITVVAVTFAVRAHNDRVLADEINAAVSALQDTDVRKRTQFSDSHRAHFSLARETLERFRMNLQQLCCLA
jgi:hypothetical protein